MVVFRIYICHKKSLSPKYIATIVGLVYHITSYNILPTPEGNEPCQEKDSNKLNFQFPINVRRRVKSAFCQRRRRVSVSQQHHPFIGCAEKW